MARRRELADVADGMTGHYLWSVGATGFPWDDDLGWTYRFDLIGQTASPESRALTKFAREASADFSRHVAARTLPPDWAVRATLEISFGPRTPRNEALLTCRVEITDDLGKEHASTRRGGVWLPERRGLRGLLGTSRRRGRAV